MIVCLVVMIVIVFVQGVKSVFILLKALNKYMFLGILMIHMLNLPANILIHKKLFSTILQRQ